LLNELKTFKNKKIDKWQLKYDLCVKYEKLNGPMTKNRVIYESINLTYWLGTQIKNMNGSELSEQRALMVNNLKTVKYRKIDKWKLTYNLCIEYENINVTIKKGTKYNNISIGSWVASQITKFNRQDLSEDKIQMMNNTKTWKHRKIYSKKKIMKTKQINKQFSKNIKLCREYESESGIISKKTKHSNMNIGKWLGSEITCLNKGQLSKERSELIRSLATWKHRNIDKWKIRYDLCVDYELKTDNTIKYNTIYSGDKIGLFISDQIKKINKNKLSIERFDKLMTLKTIIKRTNK